MSNALQSEWPQTDLRTAPLRSGGAKKDRTTPVRWRVPRLLQQKAVLPGFGLSLGLSLLYISLVILLPLSALFVYVSGMSLDQYWMAITDPRVMASYRVTLSASFWSTAAVVVIGLLLAWVLARYDFPGRRLIDAMVDLPFALPTAVAGLTLATLLSPSGWIGQWFAGLGFKLAYAWPGIVIAMTFTSLPFVVRSVQPMLQDIDPAIEEAARTLGATNAQVFTRVIMPAVLPGLVAGTSQAFIRGLGEFGAVVLIAGNAPYQTEVASLMIFVRLAEYDYASAAAIASVVLMASLGLLLTVQLLVNRWTAKRR